MKVESYELQILDKDRVPLPEHSIDGRFYVEAKSGQEFQIRFAINKNADGQYPVTSSVAYVYLDGESHGYHHFVSVNASDNITYVGYGTGVAGRCNAFEFTNANTTADYKNHEESGTGQVVLRFYEVEKCQAQHGNLKQIPVLSSAAPQPEANKPQKQPSLMTRPGREIVFQAAVEPEDASSSNSGSEAEVAIPRDTRPLPSLPPLRCPTLPLMNSWKRIRDEPDATLKVKCHTADTIHFLQVMYECIRQQSKAAAAAAEVAALAAASGTRETVTIDLTGEVPHIDVKPGVPAAATAASSSNSSVLLPSNKVFAFAVPAGPTSASKPALRLKSRASKSTMNKLQAAALHAAGTKRKLHE